MVDVLLNCCSFCFFFFNLVCRLTDLLDNEYFCSSVKIITLHQERYFCFPLFIDIFLWRAIVDHLQQSLTAFFPLDSVYCNHLILLYFILRYANLISFLLLPFLFHLVRLMPDIQTSTHHFWSHEFYTIFLFYLQ